jgi:hypothetical protein
VIRRISFLSLSLLVLSGVGVAAVPAVQAGTFHVGSNPSVVTAHSEAGGQHVATISGPSGSFNAVCDTATFEGTAQQAGGQTQTLHHASVTPTFSSCKLAGTSAAVQLNGCQYTITGSGYAANTFVIDIVNCTIGKQVQVKTALCTIDIPSQNGLSHVTATNIGGNEVTLTATVGGVTATQTGAACPHGNNFQTTNASITGNTIARAFVDEGSSLVTKHGHQYTEFKDGQEVEFIST